MWCVNAAKSAVRRGLEAGRRPQSSAGGICRLTGKLLMCTLQLGGLRPFFFVGGVGGVGIPVKCSATCIAGWTLPVAMFRCSRSETIRTDVKTRTNPLVAMTPRRAAASTSHLQCSSAHQAAAYKRAYTSALL